jgi:hypothetical protein
MKPSELSTLLQKTIHARLPILIKGAPGIGKTDIVKQACTNTSTRLIISHPVVSDPVDYKGFPFVIDNEAHFLPFGDLNQLINAQAPTAYFMDDLGQAPATVQAAAMQLILERRINGHRVSDQVTFLAATNRKTDRAGVTGILEPVKSRFAAIIELEPDVDDWVKWAIRNNLPPELIAFIRFRPNLLHDFKPSTDMDNSPCPRTVHNVARLMQADLPQELHYDAFTGAAGEGFALELIGFLKIYQTLPDPDRILTDPQGADVPPDPATLFALCGALAKKADPFTFDAIVKYGNRLPEEFCVMLVTDCITRCPDVQETVAFVDWAKAHNHVLV